MNRLPVAERREQLIEAALAVASRDGIDAATVRAVAAEAGVSLGVVHYCFQDKDELLRAMAHAITSANLERSLGRAARRRPTTPSPSSRASSTPCGPASRDSRGPQLLSYELTTSSLRHAELNQVAIEQYRGQWAAAEQVLDLRRAVGARQLVGPARAPSRARSSRSSTVSPSPGSSTATARQPAPGCRASARSSPRWPSRSVARRRLDRRRRPSRERPCPADVRPVAPASRSRLGFAAPGLRLRHRPDQPRRVQGPVRHRRRADHPRRARRLPHGRGRHGRRRPGRPHRRRQPDRPRQRASLIVAAAVVVAAVAPVFAVLALGFAVYGVGLGMVDAGTNMQAVAIQRDYGRSLLTGFYASWSVGGIARRRLRRGHRRPHRPPTRSRVALLARDARGGPRGGRRAARRLARPSPVRADGVARPDEALALPRIDARQARHPVGRRSCCSGSASSRTTSPTPRSPPGAPIYLRDVLRAAASVRAARATPPTSRRRSSRGSPATRCVRRWGRVGRAARRGARRRRRARSSSSPRPARGQAVLGFAVAGAGLGVIAPLCFSAAGDARARARGRGRRAAQRLQLRRRGARRRAGRAPSAARPPCAAGSSSRSCWWSPWRSSPAASASPGTPAHPSPPEPVHDPHPRRASRRGDARPARAAGRRGPRRPRRQRGRPRAAGPPGRRSASPASPSGSGTCSTACSRCPGSPASWATRCARRSGWSRRVSTTSCWATRASTPARSTPSRPTPSPPRAVTLMVDDAAQVELAARAADAHGTTLRLCLDVDASLKVRLGPVAAHLGVRRSPVHSAADAGALAAAIAAPVRASTSSASCSTRPRWPACPTPSPAVRAVKRLSIARPGRPPRRRRRRRAGRRRPRPVAGQLRRLRLRGVQRRRPRRHRGHRRLRACSCPRSSTPTARSRPGPPRSSGSTSSASPARASPPCSAAGTSPPGPPTKSRQPRPVWPAGLALTSREGAGEVQTPLRLSGGADLRVGDRVWFRHAKSGEVMERFEQVHLVRGTTDRGHGPHVPRRAPHLRLTPRRRDPHVRSIPVARGRPLRLRTSVADASAERPRTRGSPGRSMRGRCGRASWGCRGVKGGRAARR